MNFLQSFIDKFRTNADRTSKSDRTEVDSSFSPFKTNYGELVL